MEKKTSESTSKRERKFYSQRFIKLTKKLLKKKDVEDMPGDIKFAFESFLKSCIHHFKMTDHTESVQAEYDKEDVGEEREDEEEGIIEKEGVIEEEEEQEEEEQEEELSEEQIKEAELRSLKLKMENMYLDNFVKKTPIDIFIPHNKNKKEKLRKK
jgi:hypothetical protein